MISEAKHLQYLSQDLIQTNWVAITGGPSSGKTTLFNHLKEAEQFIVPEYAEELIAAELAAGRDVAALKKDQRRFSDLIAQNDLETYKNNDPERIIFFNTTPVCHAIYNSYYGRASYPELDQLLPIYRFQKVFILENDPQRFERTEARTEYVDQALEISNLMFEAYTNLGYQVERVPFMKSTYDRLALILSKTQYHR